MPELIAINAEKVVFEIGKNFKTIKTIPQPTFYLWLRKNYKLLYVMDYADHTGSHVQKTGEMDWQEYTELPPHEIEKDISQYLKTAV